MTRIEALETLAAKVTIEDLADLSPNMRLVLRGNGLTVRPKSTYWITLQGMIGRGLLERPENRHAPHPLTEKGLAYQRALIEQEKTDG